MQNQQPGMVQPSRVVRRVGPNGVVVQTVAGAQDAETAAGKPDPFDRELRAFSAT